MTKENEMFILYEPWQIDEAVVRAAHGTKIVCLDFLIEQELTRKGIPYISRLSIVDTETEETEWWLLAQDVAREWYRISAMEFFKHENIRIGEVVEPILAMEYLVRLFYYVRIYTALKKLYPKAHFSIPVVSVEEAETPAYNCFVAFEQRAPVDAARMIGLNFTVMNKRALARKHATSFSSMAKALAIKIYNVLIALVPRRGLKLYATEYWSHIESLMEHMSDTELVLMDSGELKHIPWRQLFKHRIRTRHPDSVAGRAGRRLAQKASRTFVEQWGRAKKEVEQYLLSVRAELEWGPVIEALDYLVGYSPRIISYIDGTRRIMEEERPDIVLQLGSLSDRYHYFFIVARVANEFDIPSIELQHASTYIDARTAFARIENKYFVTYGTNTNAWHERIGNSPNKLIPIGSPRFDQYLTRREAARVQGKEICARLGLDPNKPVLLAAIPYPANTLAYHDSYQLAEFFSTIHAAQRGISGLQVLYKCRNNNSVATVRAHVQELPPADTAIAGDEDIFALLCASDVVVCGNSTIMYQAMLAKTPLIFYGWKSFDTYNEQMYTSLAPLLHTEKEVVEVLARVFESAPYRSELLSQQQEFLNECLFDGKSSERTAALLKQISKKKEDTISV
jgi:hypothetical protein